MELNLNNVYADFFDALTDAATLDVVRKMVEGGEYCSDAIKSALGLAVKKENPFGEGEKK